MADIVERLILDDTGMIDGLRRSVTEMEKTAKAFNDLNKNIQKDTKEISKAVKKGADDMSTGLENFGKNLRRNRQELRENIGNASLFGTSLNDVTDKLKQTITNFILFRRSLNITSKITLTQAKGIVTLSNALGVSRKAITGLTVGFNVLRSAIIATGVGALVVGLGSLVAAISSSQKGMDKLGQAAGFLGGAFDVVKDKAANLGNELLEAAANGNFLSTSWEKLKGFTKSIFNGELINGIKDTTQEMIANGKAAAEITKQLQIVRREQNALESESKRQRAEIKALNKVGEDTTKSYRERSQALREAVRIEQNILSQRTALAERELDLIKQKNALSNSTDEDLQKQYDQEIVVADLKAESLELQTTLQNKLNTLEQQQLAILQQKREALSSINEAIFDAAVEANIINSEEARRKALTDQIALLEKQKKTVEDLGKALGVDVADQLRLIQRLITRTEIELGLSDVTLTDEEKSNLVRKLGNNFEEAIAEEKDGIAVKMKISVAPDSEFDAREYLNRVDELLQSDFEDFINGLDNFDDLVDGVLDNIFGEDSQIPQKIRESVGAAYTAFQEFSNIMGDIGDIAIQRNEEQIALREEQIAELEGQLDRELELQEKGLANNVGEKQQEIDTLLAEQRRYEAENEKIKQDAQKRQLAIDTVTQTQSLITSSINIIKGFSNIPVVGLPLGVAAVASLFAFFAKSKIDAFNATKLSTGADRIDDYFGFADRYGDTDLNGGQGYKIVNARTGSDTNVRISGKEMLLTERTSLTHEDFLKDLSKGYYDDLDLTAVMGFYRNFTSDIPKNLGGSISDNKPVQVDVNTAPSKQWVSFQDGSGKTKFILLEVDPNAAPGSVITMN